MNITCGAQKRRANMIGGGQTTTGEKSSEKDANSEFVQRAKKEVEELRARYGPHHPSVAEALNSMGLHYHFVVGDQQESLRFHREALGVLRLYQESNSYRAQLIKANESQPSRQRASSNESASSSLRRQTSVDYLSKKRLSKDMRKNSRQQRLFGLKRSKKKTGLLTRTKFSSSPSLMSTFRGKDEDENDNYMPQKNAAQPVSASCPMAISFFTSSSISSSTSSWIAPDPVRLAVAITLTDIGNALKLAGDCTGAMESFVEAVEVFRSMGMRDDHPRVDATLRCMKNIDRVCNCNAHASTMLGAVLNKRRQGGGLSPLRLQKKLRMEEENKGNCRSTEEETSAKKEIKNGSATLRRSQSFASYVRSAYA